MQDLDEASNNLYRFLEIDNVKDSVTERVNDMKKNVDGAQNWLASLREMVRIIKEQLSYKSRQAMSDSVKNLQGSPSLFSCLEFHHPYLGLHYVEQP